MASSIGLFGNNHECSIPFCGEEDDKFYSCPSLEHPIHATCARNYALANPDSFKCPTCQVALDVLSVFPIDRHEEVLQQIDSLRLARLLEQEDRDADEAQRLDQEDRDADEAQRLEQEDRDAEVARRLEREVRNAEVARRLQNEDPERGAQVAPAPLAPVQVAQVAQVAQPNEPNCLNVGNVALIGALWIAVVGWAYTQSGSL